MVVFIDNSAGELLHLVSRVRIYLLYLVLVGFTVFVETFLGNYLLVSAISDDVFLCCPRLRLEFAVYLRDKILSFSGWRRLHNFLCYDSM